MVATQISFIFTPNLGEDSHFDEYFSDGLKPPTSGDLVRKREKVRSDVVFGLVL